MNRFILLSFFAAALLMPAYALAQYPFQPQTQQQNTYNSNPTQNNDPLAQQNGQQNQQSTVWQYDRKYRKNAPVKTTQQYPRVLPRGRYYLYLVRTEDNLPSQATLRFITPVSVSGCVNIIPPVITMQQSGAVINFRIHDGDVELEKTANSTRFKCSKAGDIVYADIKLEREKIEQDHITTMNLQGGGFGGDIYKIDLQNNKLSLLPKTMMAFRAFTGSAKEDPLSYVFYPENTIILFAPSAPKDVDIAESISGLARMKGLRQGGILKNDGTPYFVDVSGRLARSLAFDGYAYVGTIAVPVTFDGPQGKYKREKDIDIYARRPGELD